MQQQAEPSHLPACPGARQGSQDSSLRSASWEVSQLTRPRGLGGEPLVFSFLGSGLEQASSAVGGEVGVGQAGVRERGLDSLENSCPDTGPTVARSQAWH